jgi:hypothetical protein
VDTFRRSGSDVVFTRQVTRLDEEPVPFTTSTIRLTFERLAGRAYEVQFEGHFVFQNSTEKELTARFVFPLPEAGTVRDLNVTVGETPLLEPDDSSVYQWKNTLKPGERREAIVRYKVAGSRTWQYDLGSRRRRVQAFTLEADTKGPVRFVRGSLHPVQNTRGPLRWELKNVVTAQRIALAFPPDVASRDGYLQALTALPASLIVFLLGMLILDLAPSKALLGAVVLFGLGLSAVPVLANYVGFIAGILLGPLLGAGLVLLVRSRLSLYASLPAALLPAAFLSPQHSGLLVLVLALVTLLVVSLRPPRQTKASG